MPDVVRSTRLQALGEAEASLGPGYRSEGVRERYVRELLDRRQAQEKERARKRADREERWRAIQAGEREPLDIETVLRLHSDFAGVEAPVPFRDSPAPAPQPAPAAPPGEPALTVNEAAGRLGLLPGTLRKRVYKGSVRAIRPRRGKVLVPVAEVERLAAGAVA